MEKSLHLANEFTVKKFWRKSQDGCVSKHGSPPSSPPPTTTAKTATKLQNNYHPEGQKMKLYGSLTTKELMKSQPSRWVCGTEMQNTYVDKIRRHTSGVRDPSPTPDYAAQGSSVRNKVPIISGCKNQWGLGQWKKLWDSQMSPFKGPTTDLGLTKTHSLWAAARRAPVT